MDCPFCGAAGDCAHRVSATEMATRWERRASQKKAKEASK